MMLPQFHIKPLAAALLVAGVLTACGGGGDSTPGASNNPPGGSQQNGNTNGSSNGNNTGNPPDSTSGGNDTSSQAATVMACADGDDYQCSGEHVVLADGEVAFTDFGVQAYGRSTSDQKAGSDPTNAAGFELDTGGTTEVRLGRRNDGTVERVAVLLDNLGLSWDGAKNRPKIIEGFDPTQGMVTEIATSIGSKLKFDNPLPPSSNLNYYNFATAGRNATQANYAHNRYFPRDGGGRCPANSESWCGSKETDGPQSTPGDWRSGGSRPDAVNATRFHEDGDIHAGNDVNGLSLNGDNKYGVPFPGSKGFRTYTGFSYRYANLGAWLTQDTVLIAEWTGQDGTKEHSTNRRGVVAFGALTNPAKMPASGTASYSGRIYGRYVANRDADPVAFDGKATITVDFAKNEATVTIEPESANGAAPAPVGFSATMAIGKGNGNLRNAMSGAANSGNLSGRVAGRYFGPVESGSTAPAESGGTFALKNASTGAAVVGGFIARKQ